MIDFPQWPAWKGDIVGITDLDRDALHIYAGVGIQIATALLARRKLGDWVPWLVVLLVALLIEAGDVTTEHWHSLALQLGKSVHDVVNTMILPTALMFVARRWPGLLGRS